MGEVIYDKKAWNCSPYLFYCTPTVLTVAAVDAVVLS